VDQNRQPRRQPPPTRRLLQWAGGITAAVLLVSISIGYRYGITLWDWITVLVLPITVGAAVPLLNKLQKDRELAIEGERKDRELAIQDQYAQDTALQAYLDQMSQLMLLDVADEPDTNKPKPLRKSTEADEVRTLARARTLTVLRRLGSGRKRRILDFLYEAGLIGRRNPIIDLGSTDFFSSVADLRGADLRGADLRGADLSGLRGGQRNNGPNLSEADLRGANLSGVVLSFATLRGADLSAAVFYSDINDRTHEAAELREADLRGAYLIGTDFRGAKLGGADLRGAYFRRPEVPTQQYTTELREAGLPEDRIQQAIEGQTDLRGADLSDAKGITSEDLEQQAALLEDATMPNGQKYKDRLKSKDQEENGPNGGAS
jgi:uncharacterized protein YjbI with pentapeptide repeats